MMNIRDYQFGYCVLYMHCVSAYTGVSFAFAGAGLRFLLYLSCVSHSAQLRGQNVITACRLHLSAQRP